MPLNSVPTKDSLVEQGVIDGTKAFTGPYGLQVGITGICNYVCEFCATFSYLKPKEQQDAVVSPQIPSGKFLELVSDAADMNVEQISIVGVGEPFLHPDIMLFIKKIKERSIRLMITTNGSRLTEHVVDELCRRKLNILNVSLNSASRETYAKIHGDKQGRFFDRIMKALERFKILKNENGGPWLSLRFVMTRRNIDEVESFIRLAIEKKVDEIVLQNCVEPEFARDIGLSLDDKKKVAEVLKTLRDETNGANLKSNIDFVIARYSENFGAKDDGKYLGYTVNGDYYRRYPCYTGWTYVMVLENGDVRPCCYCLKPLGNISTSSFKDIWFGKTYNSFRERSKNLPISQETIPGCACFGSCGSVLDNIKTLERFKGRLGVAHPSHAE